MEGFIAITTDITKELWRILFSQTYILKNQVDHSHPSTSSNFIFLEFQVHLVLISPRWRRVECGREWRR